MMKTHYVIRVYILTDKQGEWWETLKRDGSLRRFEPGTSNFNKDREFKDEGKAITFCQSLHVNETDRFEVVRLDPPTGTYETGKRNRTWGQAVVYEHNLPAGVESKVQIAV